VSHVGYSSRKYQRPMTLLEKFQVSNFVTWISTIMWSVYRSN